MAVTAVLPVPIGFAGRREAVFASVAGVSPLVRVVRVLEQRCDVVVASAAPLAAAVREALAGQNFSRVPVVVSVPSGERVQCVAAGLRGLAEGGEVLVHDIGWPIVGAGTLGRVIASLRDGAVAVMPASPVTDSVKAVGIGGVLAATLDRSQLRTVQYPRGFAVDVLANLVKRSGSGTFDELEAALSTGTPLTFIEGDDDALSVDLPRDADYLAALILGRESSAGR